MRLPAGSQSGSPLKSHLLPQQVKHLRHQVCLLGRSSSWARGGRCCLMPGFLPAELLRGCRLLPVPQVCAVCESSPQRLTQQHPQRRRGAAGEKPPRCLCDEDSGVHHLIRQNSWFETRTLHWSLRGLFLNLFDNQQ